MSDQTPPAAVAVLDELARSIGAVSPEWAALLPDTMPTAYATTTGLHRSVTLGVEAIREGWLLHRDESRLLEASTTSDLRLLIGDWCYASGLCEVSEHGTLDQVRVLADLIADVAHLPERDASQHEAAWDEALKELTRTASEGPHGPTPNTD